MKITDLAQVSLVDHEIVESKIPLWWADGATMNTSVTSAGSAFLADGANTGQANTTPTQTHLFALNSNWPSSLEYAFEATLYNSNSSYTSHAELWDVTANAVVSGSQVAVTSTTATVIRSGKFTLTPGHTYGVSVWADSGIVYVVDASLIVLP